MKWIILFKACITVHLVIGLIKSYYFFVVIKLYTELRKNNMYNIWFFSLNFRRVLKTLCPITSDLFQCLFPKNTDIFKHNYIKLQPGYLILILYCNLVESFYSDFISYPIIMSFIAFFFSLVCNSVQELNFYLCFMF